MMYRIFFSCLLILITAYAEGQQPAWDSTHRPSNYGRQLDNFRSYPNASTDIIMLGNSITDYAQWNELLGIPQVRNRGISGDNTFGILQRLDEVTEGKPAKVFILIGINDIARNFPDSVIISNYRRIIHRIQNESPSTKIYFNTLLPVNNSFESRPHFNKDEHIANINDAIRKLAATEPVTVIDSHPYFLDADKRLDKQYTYDGLHLNAAGYKVWASILKPYITR